MTMILIVVGTLQTSGKETGGTKMRGRSDTIQSAALLRS